MDVVLVGRLCIIFVFFIGSAPATCRFPGAPAHCRVAYSDKSLTEGTYAFYECERGFELLGPSRKMCGPNGQWIPDGIPFCVLNVAAGKAPMQVSTYESGVPQRALDGSTAPAFNPDTCTLTKTERTPWWYVNLLEPYMVQLVRLDFGIPCCGSNESAVVVVRVGNNRPDNGTNPICNRFTGTIEEGQPLFLPCHPPMPGAFVSVHLESSKPSQLSICEAFVYTDQALPIERCPQFRDQPPGSTATYNGKCYIFYDNEPASFKDALGLCRSRGGSLVDESNSALQGFISWELWRRHRSESSSQYWMGAVRDPQDPENWKWVNGNNVTVSFWNVDPDGSKGCARFDGSNGWLWADTDCQTRINYICQHQPKTCGRPEQPPNSTMLAAGFGVGSSVEYACDDGYLLVGPTVRTCLDTGFYDEFPPVCKRIECGYPAMISHGTYSLLNNSVSYLAHVQYSCKPGYEMVGRARLVCDIDERWNGPPPRCEEIHCGDPPLITIGRAILDHNATTFGSVVKYACPRGHTLRGAAKIECLASGLWDHPPPSCHPDEPLPTTTTTTTTTTTKQPLPTLTTPEATTPRLLLRRTSARPVSSPTPFLPAVTRTTMLVETPPRRVKPRPDPERSTTRVYEQPPERKITVHDSHDSPTSHVPHIIVASHPRENESFGSSNIRAEQTPRVNAPTGGEAERPTGMRLNIGAVVALAAFGALVFLIAIITTIVILFRCKKHKGSRSHPGHMRPCNTVDSAESSSSESRSGLTRYYQQAWEDLHEAAGDIGRDNAVRLRDREAPQSRFQLVVEPPTPGDTNFNVARRHHHHHHHHHPSPILPMRKQSCSLRPMNGRAIL